MFKGVYIAGGVCYYLSDKQYTGKCNFYNHYDDLKCIDSIDLGYIKTLIRHKEMRDIVCKVESHKEITLDTQVSNTAPFGFKRAYRGSTCRTDREDIRLISSDYDTFVSMNDISKNRELVNKYNVYVGYNQTFNNGELSSVGILKPNEVCTYTFVSMNDISKNRELVNKYNVYVGYNQTFNNGELSSVGILKPNEVCTLTYILVGNFECLVDAENCEKYIKTKFVRALIREVTSTLGVTAKNYRLVPVQNFTSSSDLVDAENCEKYIKTKFVRALIREVTSTLGVTAKNYRLVPVQNFTSSSDIDWSEKYIKTKFVRALIREVTSTLGVTAKNYRLVPVQNFTSSSDIDWSQSITDIDRQLYKKYGLTDAEIQYIEKTIKAME